MKERGDGGASQRAEEIEGPSSRELEVSSRESVERSVTYASVEYVIFDTISKIKAIK